MRQTYIVALLSAVVLADDWLANPTTDEVIAHLGYDWTVPVTDEERARLRKEMEDASNREEIELSASVDSLQESLSLTIRYVDDVLQKNSSGRSNMTTEWEINFGGNNNLLKSAVYDENTESSKFSVGICWKSSELEKIDKGKLEFDWDCQMQLLKFTDLGDQIFLKPVASSWTLTDKQTTNNDSNTFIKKSTPYWFANESLVINCESDDEDYYTCDPIKFSATHEQDEFTSDDEWKRYQAAWPTIAIYAEEALDSVGDQWSKIKGLQGYQGSDFYPWHKSLIAQQHFITDVDSFEDVIEDAQEDYNELLADMRQKDQGYRIDTQKWQAALTDISEANLAKIAEVTNNSITENSGEAYTFANFGPINSSTQNRIDALVTQYATLDAYQVNWDKEDHVLEGLASMKTSYDNMKKIYDMLQDVVKSYTETEDSVIRNQQAITAAIASLKGRYGDKMGDEETSQINEIEDRNNGIRLTTEDEIKQSQDGTYKDWEEQVFGLPWGDMEDHGAEQMEAAEKLKAQLDQANKDGILSLLEEQQEDQKAIKKLFDRYSVAQKYGFEKEGAVTIGGCMAALAATAFAALI